jgi:hypothetical protein
MLQQLAPSRARRRVATILAAAVAMTALAALAVTMLVPALADDGDPGDGSQPAVAVDLGQRVARCALQINSPWQGDPDIGQVEFWVSYKAEGYSGYYVAANPVVVDTKITDFGGDNVDLDGDVTSISTRGGTVLQTDTYTHLWATKHKSDGTTDGSDWTPPGLRTNADVATLEQYGEWAASGRYCDAHALTPQTYVPQVEAD